MAEAILSIISDGATRKRKGQAGRQRIESHFSGRACAEGFERVYQEVVNNYACRQSSQLWEDIFMGFASDIGILGSRVMEHERLIQGLKDFEGLFKNNFFYRTLRSVYNSLRFRSKT